ncbi:MAG TPA: hypothetical protein PKA41_17370 [Verrucomicrobiota bacterium]|nr:hypothetical protein [Verrucomicrobiota bacterium]
MFARLARKRVARDEARADLRQLRCMVAALALLKGGAPGKQFYETTEASLIEQANAGLIGGDGPPEKQHGHKNTTRSRRSGPGERRRAQGQ